MEPEKFKEPDVNPTPEPEKVPENEIIEKKGLSRKEKNIAIGAVVLLIIQGANIVWGINRSFNNIKTYSNLMGALNNMKAQSEQITSETNQSVQTTGETTIVTVDSTHNTQSTTNPEINNSGSLEIFEQTISVEAMDKMTIEEFAKVSYVDRAAYVYMKNPELNVANVKDTFDPNMILGFYWRQLEIAAFSAKDTTEGAKTLSALAYYTTNKQTGEISDVYQANVDSVIKAGGVGVIGYTYAYVDNGPTQIGKDRDGNNIKYTNITYKQIDLDTGEFDQRFPEKTV